MGFITIAKRIPILGPLAARTYRRLVPYRRASVSTPFRGSAEYWEERYRTGGNSGVGSYDLFAEFKADVLNDFVRRHHVTNVIEFGCGDGNQLRLAAYPQYLGLDVSPTAVDRCQAMFGEDPNKRFATLDAYRGESADLALSLDVIYHLVEDEVFDAYMRQLFQASTGFVGIYAADTESDLGTDAAHVRQRPFSRWIKAHAPDWQLIEHVPNRYPYRGDYKTGSFSEFFMYEQMSRA